MLPRLSLTSHISWLVDTGADSSLLLPGDGMRMGIDYAQLGDETESIGIGGISVNYREQAALIFSEPNRSLYVYLLNLAISAPSPEIMDLPSLLGRDILDRWRMSYDPMRGGLEFEVISADETIPLGAARRRTP